MPEGKEAKHGHSSPSIPGWNAAASRGDRRL